MDSYERLVAINETMMGNKPKPKVKKENPVAKFSKAVAGIEKKSPDQVAADLKTYYDKQDSGDSPFGRSILDSFNPSVNPNKKIDQEFDNARDALRKSGIPHMGQRAIGSMDRERNRLRVHPKFEKEAKQALKGFPKVDLEINDKMPEQPMKRKVKEEVQKETDMDPYQRLEAINETLTRIFAEDVDPDRYVSVGDRKTVEFGRRTMDLSPEDRDKARRSADRKTAKEKRQAPKGSKAAHNVIGDAGRRYRVGTQRPTDPDDPKHENLRIAAAINAAIARGMSDE